MKKTIVIFATLDVSSFALRPFTVDKETDHKIEIIDIDKSAESFTEMQSIAVENADIIIVEYNEEKMVMFAKHLATALLVRYEHNRSTTPIFHIIYDGKLRKTPLLLQGLISSTKETFLMDLLYPHLTLESENWFETPFASVNVRIKDTTTMEEVRGTLNRVYGSDDMPIDFFD